MNALINEVTRQSQSAKAKSPGKEQQTSRGKRKKNSDNNEDRRILQGTATDGNGASQRTKKKKVSGNEDPTERENCLASFCYTVGLFLCDA